MVGVGKLFKTVPIMKAFGRITFLMEEAFLFRQMVASTKENSKMIRVMGSESMSQQMANSSTKGNLKTTCKTDLELKLKLVNISIKDTLRIEQNRVQEQWFGKTIKSTKVFGKMGTFMGKENSQRLIQNMKEDGVREKCMGKVSITGMMDDPMLVTITWTKNREMDDMIMETGRFMRENGWMDTHMGKVQWRTRMD